MESKTKKEETEKVDLEEIISKCFENLFKRHLGRFMSKK